MNREIEFRGKDIKSGKWVYGYYYYENDEHLIKSNNKYLSYNCKIVDPETVGQYMGLKDKFGKKIYEGDIIKYKYHEELYVIKFIEFAFWCEGTRGIYVFVPTQNKRNYMEIIGNKDDNPELLNEK